MNHPVTRRSMSDLLGGFGTTALMTDTRWAIDHVGTLGDDPEDVPPDAVPLPVVSISALTEATLALS